MRNLAKPSDFVADVPYDRVSEAVGIVYPLKVSYAVSAVSALFKIHTVFTEQVFRLCFERHSA